MSGLIKVFLTANDSGSMLIKLTLGINLGLINFDPVKSNFLTGSAY